MGPRPGVARDLQSYYYFFSYRGEDIFGFIKTYGRSDKKQEVVEYANPMTSAWTTYDDGRREEEEEGDKHVSSDDDDDDDKGNVNHVVKEEEDPVITRTAAAPAAAAAAAAAALPAADERRGEKSEMDRRMEALRRSLAEAASGPVVAIPKAVVSRYVGMCRNNQQNNPLSLPV